MGVSEDLIPSGPTTLAIPNKSPICDGSMCARPARSDRCPAVNAVASSPYSLAWDNDSDSEGSWAAIPFSIIRFRARAGFWTGKGASSLIGDLPPEGNAGLLLYAINKCRRLS